MTSKHTEAAIQTLVMTVTLLLKDVSKLALMMNAMVSPLKLPKQDFITLKTKRGKNGGRRQKSKFENI